MPGASRADTVKLKGWIGVDRQVRQVSVDLA